MCKWNVFVKKTPITKFSHIILNKDNKNMKYCLLSMTMILCLVKSYITFTKGKWYTQSNFETELKCFRIVRNCFVPWLYSLFWIEMISLIILQWESPVWNNERKLTRLVSVKLITSWNNALNRLIMPLCCYKR